MSVSRLNVSTFDALLSPSLAMRSSRSESSVGAEPEAGPNAWFDMDERFAGLG